MVEYQNDQFDGRQVPPLVVRDDYVLRGVHEGTVHVERGRFELLGTLQGTLDLQPGTSAAITGAQQGTVHVGSGVTVNVTGDIQGTTTIDYGATVVIEPSGTLAGCLTNHGVVVLRGVFGGPYDGTGEMRVEDDGRIKKPRIEDGVHYYEW